MGDAVIQPVFVDTLPVADLGPGMQKTWQRGLQRVLLCRSAEGNIHAMLDVCPHARQPMSGGVFDDCSITCPRHGARFDIRSGAPINRVTQRPLQILPVRIHAGIIQVGLS